MILYYGISVCLHNSQTLQRWFLRDLEARSDPCSIRAKQGFYWGPEDHKQSFRLVIGCWHSASVSAYLGYGVSFDTRTTKMEAEDSLHEFVCNDILRFLMNSDLVRQTQPSTPTPKYICTCIRDGGGAGCTLPSMQQAILTRAARGCTVSSMQPKI